MSTKCAQDKIYFCIEALADYTKFWIMFQYMCKLMVIFDDYVSAFWMSSCYHNQLLIAAEASIWPGYFL
jgi:hypothetical protein